MITNYGLENKITINRNDNLLQLIKDGYIYEVYYNNTYLGYFHESRLEDAIKSITETGFYNGYNYDYRIQNIKEGKAV
jgi:hypothetical protein